MTLPFLVTVDGFKFRGDARTDEGATISPDGWEGWEDSVEARGESVAIQQGVGDFDLATFPGSRIVRIAGTCWAESAEKTQVFGNRIRGLLLRGPGRMVVHHYGETTWGNCRLAPGVKTQFQARGYDPRIADWQIQLKFANPRKFGETRVFASNVDAVHYGNYDAIPEFKIIGTAPNGYTLNGPNNLGFDVTLPVTSGHPHTVVNGAVYVDGVRRHGVTGDHADTWLVAPNSESRTVLTFAANANLDLEQRVTDTWI